MPKGYNYKDDATMKPAFNKIGLFSELGYLSPGPQKPESDPLLKGRQMLPGYGHTKTGTNDGYFTPFTRVFEGEDYRDYLSHLRRYRMKDKSKQRNGPFHNMFGSKDMNGRAMLWGTFTEDYEAFSPEKKQMGKPVKELRGVYTNPSKKGTGYGYADVCFDKYPEHLDESKVPEKSVQLAPFVKDRSPFYNQIQSGEYFGPNPYVPDKPGPVYNMKFKKNEGLKPFYPTSTPKRPGNKHDGCFDKFPEWTSELYVKEAKRLSKDSKTKSIFVPTPGPKSTRTNSVFRQYISKHVHGKNWNSVVPVEYSRDLNLL